MSGHAIETLTWETIGNADREAALAHQARLGTFLNGAGRLIIARVFSRMSAPGEAWRLDRLELDTGPLAPDGNDSQWGDILERQLTEALLAARQARPVPLPGGIVAVPGNARRGHAPRDALTGSARRPSDTERLEHFLFYLQHGHLPWSRSAIAGRGLSAWLARLAQRTGPRLWSLLRALRPAHFVIERLSQITPYEGLQALIGVRHRTLAESLDALDAEVLMPLQARGRLSAWQVRQLQQAWRVAAVRTLWAQQATDLGADDVQRLRRELGAALAQQLGQGGFGAWRPALRHAPGRTQDATLEAVLLAGLVEAVSPRAPDGAMPAAGTVAASGPQTGWPDAPAGRRPLDAALGRLGAALDGSAPLQQAALAVLLDDLHRRAPDALRVRLRALLLGAPQGQDQVARHGARVTLAVARALGPRRHPLAAAGSDVHWAESQRQFALAALARGARAGASAPGGLSALQRWLAAYTLRQLALGEPAPTSRRGWEQLWQRALADWQGHAVARPARRTVSQAGSASSSAGGTAGAPPWRWHVIHRVATRAERLRHLLALPRHRAAARDWMVRRQIGEWLADPVLCEDWLHATRPAQRWALVATLHPRQSAALRRASQALEAAHAALVAGQSESARQRSHWRFLAGHVLAMRLAPTPEALARRHALHLYREAGAPTPGRSALAQWFARVRQWMAAPSLAGDATARLPRGLGAWFRVARRALRGAPDAVERVQAEAPRHGAPAPQPAPWKGTASAAADLPELAVLPTLGDSDTHYIGDAGLVLLATYSQRLFGMLDLLDGKTLRDAQAAARAVRCLAWLAHGHDQASEPECVLPKLLCGMPLDAPLVGEGALDAATRRLLDDLIGAVIGHWSALGKTSPEGLRQTFLLREGRLTRESNDSGHHWRLAVKPGPFDMLLDRLPWSFSTIKLPWMQEVMYVDWR